VRVSSDELEMEKMVGLIVEQEGSATGLSFLNSGASVSPPFALLFIVKWKIFFPRENV